VSGEVGETCPICGKTYSSAKTLMQHLRKHHGVSNPKEFLSNPELWAQAQSTEPQAAVEAAAEAHEEERRIKVKVKGIEIEQGDCIRVVIARNIFIVRVRDFSEALPIAVGEDIYGNTISVDLRKALVISKISSEKFEELKKRAKEMEVVRKKKRKGEG
jgi:head-tail adaptor